MAYGLGLGEAAAVGRCGGVRVVTASRRGRRRGFCLGVGTAGGRVGLGAAGVGVDGDCC